MQERALLHTSPSRSINQPELESKSSFRSAIENRSSAILLYVDTHNPRTSSKLIISRCEITSHNFNKLPKCANTQGTITSTHPAWTQVHTSSTPPWTASENKHALEDLTKDTSSYPATALSAVHKNMKMFVNRAQTR